MHDHQKEFVASNVYSLAQVQFLNDFTAMGVYLNEKMIGFAMYGIDPDDHNFWIYRLMIDQSFQGQGLGYQATLAVIADIKSRNHRQITCIMIGYQPDNDGARFTYKKAGFVEQEMAPWGEQLAKYDL